MCTNVYRKPCVSAECLENPSYCVRQCPGIRRCSVCRFVVVQILHQTCGEATTPNSTKLGRYSLYLCRLLITECNRTNLQITAFQLLRLNLTSELEKLVVNYS